MSQSLINYGNADKIETQMEYPEFFDIIRNHRAYTLNMELDNALMAYDPANPTNHHRIILNEYKKEKAKLMKLLQPFKNVCKQIGVVIDRVMYQRWERALGRENA